MYLREFLKEQKFDPFGKIFEVHDKDDSLVLGYEINDTVKGWVYLWVIEKNENPILIIYIGKTIGFLHERMGGHESGSKYTRRKKYQRKIESRNEKGMANADYIRKFIKEFAKMNYGIRGYARHSRTINMLGSKVSICEAEETAFKNIFSQNGCDTLLLNDKTTKNLNDKRDEWLEDVKSKLRSKTIYKTFPVTKPYKIV